MPILWVEHLRHSDETCPVLHNQEEEKKGTWAPVYHYAAQGYCFFRVKNVACLNIFVHVVFVFANEATV